MNALFPSVLTALPQWITWRYEKRQGKQTKVPYSPATGRHASVTTARDWVEMEVARKYAEMACMDGLGFVFTASDPFVGIDLDHCYDPNAQVMETWAEAIILRLDSYTELSASRTGVHIILKGRLPVGMRRKGAIEVYDNGRFFCMTGATIWEGHSCQIEDREKELLAWYTETFGTNGYSVVPPPPPPPPTPILRTPTPSTLTQKIQALLENDDGFYDVWNHTSDAPGQKDESASGRDFVLAQKAVTAGLADDEIVEMLVEYRKKWNEDSKYPGYFTRTAARARRWVGTDRPTIQTYFLDEWGLDVVHVLRYIPIDEDTGEHGEPVYRMEIEGHGWIDVGHVEVIDNYNLFRRRIMALTNLTLPHYTPKTWIAESKRLLAMAETSNTGLAGTPRGIVYGWLDEYLSRHINRPIADIALAVSKHQPFFQGGKLHIFADSLRGHLGTALHEFVAAGDLGASLQAAGCSLDTISYAKADGTQSSVTCWTLPSEVAGGHGGIDEGHEAVDR